MIWHRCFWNKFAIMHTNNRRHTTAKATTSDVRKYILCCFGASQRHNLLIYSYTILNWSCLNFDLCRENNSLVPCLDTDSWCYHYDIISMYVRCCNAFDFLHLLPSVPCSFLASILVRCVALSFENLSEYNEYAWRVCYRLCRSIDICHTSTIYKFPFHKQCSFVW